MAAVRKLTEDEVRDGYTDSSSFHKGAKQILGFDSPETDVQQGTGQLKTFNQLGFKGKGRNNKPDGWYLPNDTSKVAIILETKSEDEDLSNQKWVDELLKNVDIASMKYNKIIGILYNGTSVRVFKDRIELTDIAPNLQHKQYYIDLFLNTKIDKNRIYDLTRSINDTLHFDFKMNDLKDRMVFTACALVVQRFNPVGGLKTQKGQTYDIVHVYISSKLALAINTANAGTKKPNLKLGYLLEKFNAVSVATKSKTLDKVIDSVCEISNLINSNNWNGEDVMAIFFNEFSRYARKTSDGQVFTPEHIASFMYRLIDVHMDDNVLEMKAPKLIQFNYSSADFAA